MNLSKDRETEDTHKEGSLAYIVDFPGERKYREGELYM